jgi:hypothetical protein
MKEYLVERSPQLLVLMSEDEIRRELKSRRLTLKTRIFEEPNERWIEIGRLPAFVADTYFHPAQKKEWYILQGLTPIGPHSYLEILKLVQTKRLHATQLAWKSGMSDWQALCHTKEFHADNLRLLSQAQFPMLKVAFVQRKSHRLPFQSDFIIHTERQVWRARSYEIGIGGVGLWIEGHGLSPGQVFYLHHVSRAELTTFSAMGQVVSRLKDEQGILPDKWGIEFTDIRSTDQIEIRNYINKILSGPLRLSSR